MNTILSSISFSLLFIYLILKIFCSSENNSIYVLISNVSLLVAIALLCINQLISEKNSTHELHELHEFIISRSNDHPTVVDKINIPVYYINLEKSIDRNKFIQDQFKKYDIQGTRIDGIYGKNLAFQGDVIKLRDGKNVKFVNTFTSKNGVWKTGDYDNSPGELGCTLSHIKAIYNAYTNGDNYALIMEDDVSFVLYPYWLTDLQKIMIEAPKDWNIITLYNLSNAHRQSKNKYTKCKLSFPCWSTAAYIINRKGMENVLRVLNHGVIDLHSSRFPEIQLSEWKGKKTLAADFLIYYKAGKTYSYNYFPTVIQYNADDFLESTIHNDHIKRHNQKSLDILKKASDLGYYRLRQE